MSNTPTSIIVLIHGTFARRSKWFQAGSELSKKIEALLPGPILFVSHSWSGMNSQAARRQGSRAVTHKILELKSRYPDSPVFILAHSHGGNVALYALDDDTSQSAVAGVICLNTPFITATRRHTQNVVVFLIKLACLLLASWCAIFGTTNLLFSVTGFIGYRMSQNNKWEFLAVGLSLLIACLLLLLSMKCTRPIDAYFQRKRESAIAEIRLPRITKTTVFCVWSASDEVYGVFSLLETVANIPYQLLHVVFPSVAFVAGAVHASMDIPFRGLWAAAVEGRAASNLAEWLYWIAGVVGEGSGLLLEAFLFAGAYIAVLIGIALVLNFVLRLVPIGLSWQHLFNSFFVRLSFGLVPVTASHIIFRDVASPYRLLNHSASYQDDQVIRILAEWIAGVEAK